MNPKFTRWAAVSALAVGAMVPLLVRSVRGQDSAPAVVSAVDQLKLDAFRALRVGNFDRGNDLLAKAARASADPALGRMHQWTESFEAELKRFADERHVAYAKAMADVQTMRRAGRPDAALDLATRAQLLSDNKAEFQNLPWMRTLIDDGTRRGAGYESADQWLSAMRVYEDLESVEPASREWKEKFKTVTRRERLLSTYAPDAARKQLEAYLVQRESDDAFIKAAQAAATQPGTRPATMPTLARSPATTKPADGAAALVDPAAFKVDWKVDWHDGLKGIQLAQLTASINDIDQNYYRDVSYKQLLADGIAGLDALVNTPGLEAAFPNLADAGKKAEFQRFLDGWRQLAKAATADNEEQLINQFLSADDKDGMLAASGRTLSIPDAVLITEFADGAKTNLDPFTDVIWPTGLPEFRKLTQGEFSGVGIQIEADNGDLRVVEPLPDSPAEAAGVTSGDVIASIDGRPAKGVTTDQAVKFITGPTGTKVRLTLRSPDGKSRDVTLRRRKIQVASVKGYSPTGLGKWDYYVDPDSHVAYIRIMSFTQTTAKELKAVVDELGDNCQGIILDLRNNPGGLLPAAIGVCDEFLKSGTIVSTHPDRDTQNLPFRAAASDDGTEFTKPLVVMVNQYSASASEIVSGALKDQHRAILVGERTYGKGSVQQLFPLPPDDDCIIKLTTSHYYLPSGRCIHREENSTTWGVDPDVTVELTPEQMSAMLVARRKMDVFHAVAAPIGGSSADAKLHQSADAAAAAEGMPNGPTTNPATRPVVEKPSDLLSVDPQLAAAVLVMRLELAGAKL